jgi:beta-lactamase regulating signal transducer with metallopeptidase domain
MHDESIVAWLLTFALHASVLLALAWIADRGVLRQRPAWRELLWRTALFGGLLTASVQTMLDLRTSARFAVPVAQKRVPVAAIVSTDDPVERESATAIAPTPSAERGSGFSRDTSHNQSIATELAPTAALQPLGVDAAAAADARRVSGAETESTSHGEQQAKLLSSAGLSWQTLLLAAWLAGSLLALFRLAATWWRLERAVQGAEPLQNAAIATDAAALALQAGVRAPRLSVLDELASPFAARGRRIVLPRWACELLDREQLRAMLAHETAHLARHDASWKLAIAICRSLLWFMPLAGIARRRLDEAAELACDAWAARHLGDGRSLAECLAECAERRLEGFESWLAPAMAQRESPLLQRIDHLIGGTPMNTTLSHLRAGSAAVLALALAILLLPGFGTQAQAQPAPPSPPSPPSPPAPPAPPAAPKAGSESHIHISSSDTSAAGKKHQTTTISSNDGHRSIEVKIKGEIAFNDNDDDVASLSDGGSASFAETKDGVERRVQYRSQGGKIERRCFVDDVEHPFDAAQQAWISAFLPAVIRDSAIGAEARVKRIYAKGGTGAVLDEIGRIDGDYARGEYLKQLFATAKLSPAEVTRAIGLIDAIGSDYERRNVLAALAGAAPLDAQQQKLVIGQAEKIGSDYERAELLTSMVPQLASQPDVREAWLHAAAKLGSDYEHRRTLTALLDNTQLDDAMLGEVITSANSIGSDYERRELLVSALRRVGDSERVAPMYAKAVDSIGSDYERREALLALIRAPKFGAGASNAVLDAAGSIGSDFECREVLVALARVMPNDAGLITRYRKVAGKLSDSERGAAERALDRFQT